MTNTKKKKSAREKRILAASLIVAAVMIGGSTFAWFTSKDEVTNRLSASADYNVSIAEDFTPPENWIPGQKIDKNVGFVNTGNVDAFVRSYLQGEMRVVNEATTDVATWNLEGTNANKFTNLAASVKDDLTPVTDETLTALNLNYSITAGPSETDKKTYYLRELRKGQLDNPTTQTTSSNPDAYSEVMAVQAGGELVYTNGTKFTYTPNQSMTVHNKNNEIQNIIGDKVYTVTVDTSNTNYITVTNSENSNTISVSDIKYLPSIDSDNFKPATTGLYIFRRNVDMNTNVSEDDMEFSGYYYVASATDETAGSGVYLKLHNDSDGRSDYTLPENAFTATYHPSSDTDENKSGTWTYAPTTSLRLYTAERKTVDNTGLIWTYTAPKAADGTNPATQGYLTATYHDIIINVYLANIYGENNNTAVTNGATTGKDANLKWLTANTDAESWTPISDAANNARPVTFYYNNDLEEGCTTERLVDTVELDSSVTQNAYLAFDFDLNVFMESVQVAIDESGKEIDTPVNPLWETTNTDIVAAKGSATNTANEITKITWTKTST